FVHRILEEVGKKEYAEWVSLLGFMYILLMVVRIVDGVFEKIRWVFLFE
ncbi:SpoIIIAC/SpoIIIAD family protein, partial [Siminovitchia fortis]